jgi:hypothetical protein
LCTNNGHRRDHTKSECSQKDFSIAPWHSDF